MFLTKYNNFEFDLALTAYGVWAKLTVKYKHGGLDCFEMVKEYELGENRLMGYTVKHDQDKFIREVFQENSPVPEADYLYYGKLLEYSPQRAIAQARQCGRQHFYMPLDFMPVTQVSMEDLADITAVIEKSISASMGLEKSLLGLFDDGKAMLHVSEKGIKNIPQEEISRGK